MSQTCQECEEEFEPKRSDQKYCSRECCRKMQRRNVGSLMFTRHRGETTEYSYGKKS